MEEQFYGYCSGQCRASRSHPSICRCICQGRNHGSLLYRNPVVNVTPYPYTNPYEGFNREIPQLPEERLRLTAQEIARDIDGIKASLAPALRDGENERGRDNSGPAFPNSIIAKKGKYRIAKRLGKALKHSISGYSQDELNRRIRDGLRQQFNEENTDLAIFQAFQIRQSKQPDANRPELYELYETGEIDEALELMGKSWHIGRPKRR